MCRLFGFRSSQRDAVHSPLVTERNSLRVQSREHPDGWGIAYYDGRDAPIVAHGVGAAHSDPEFERVSNFVTSQSVVAHVRLASVGGIDLRNAHPFAHRHWTFAHNGTLRGFARHRERFLTKLDPKYLPLFRGETDSEVCFYLFLTRLEQLANTLDRPTIDEVALTLAWAADYATSTTPHGPDEKPSSANFLVTDGELMLCTRINRSLFFSERKKKDLYPPDRPEAGTRLDQFIVSSEELSVGEHWHEVPERTVIGVDRDLTLRLWRLDDLLG